MVRIIYYDESGIFRFINLLVVIYFKMEVIYQGLILNGCREYRKVIEIGDLDLLLFQCFFFSFYLWFYGGFFLWLIGEGGKRLDFFYGWVSFVCWFKLKMDCGCIRVLFRGSE